MCKTSNNIKWKWTQIISFSVTIVLLKTPGPICFSVEHFKWTSHLFIYNIYETFLAWWQILLTILSMLKSGLRKLLWAKLFSAYSLSIGLCPWFFAPNHTTSWLHLASGIPSPASPNLSLTKVSEKPFETGISFKREDWILQESEHL